MTQPFFVKGNPVPQPRPRFKVIPLGGGKHSVQAYTPKKHPVTEWRRILAAEFAARDESYEGALDVSLVFFLRRPRSHFRTGKNAHLLKASAPLRPTMGRDVGDVDNIAKSVLDEASGTLWHDDKQVCSLHVLKQFATTEQPAGVYVQVRQCPDPTNDPQP